MTGLFWVPICLPFPECYINGIICYVLCAQTLSHVQLFMTPWTVAHQAIGRWILEHECHLESPKCNHLGIYSSYRLIQQIILFIVGNYSIVWMYHRLFMYSITRWEIIEFFPVLSDCEWSVNKHLCTDLCMGMFSFQLDKYLGLELL